VGSYFYIKGSVVIKIKIKGKITPYTPKYSQRIIARKDIPLSDNKLCCIDSIYQPDTQTREKVIYVNGRKCRMQHHWETFYAICPVDEPLPPRKPRISEQEAVLGMGTLRKRIISY
jgi:hypothetical protein